MAKEITKRLIGPDNSLGRLSEITETKLSTLTEDEIKLVTLFKSLSDLSNSDLLEKLKSSTEHDEKLLIMTTIVDNANMDSKLDTPDILELRNLVKQDEYKNLMLEVYNLTNGIEDKDDFWYKSN